METLSAASKIRSNIQELFEAKSLAENAYIRFLLGKDLNVLFPMEEVRESLLIDTEQITPLPSMHPSTIGMINSRDRVFCIFDLAQILKLPSWSISPRQYQVIVMQTKDELPIYVGLAVAQLQGIIRLSEGEIQENSAGVSSTFTDYISGVVEQESNALPILDFNLILQALTQMG